jgi:hypothetical protein
LCPSGTRHGLPGRWVLPWSWPCGPSGRQRRCICHKKCQTLWPWVARPHVRTLGAIFLWRVWSILKLTAKCANI